MKDENNNNKIEEIAEIWLKTIITHIQHKNNLEVNHKQKNKYEKQAPKNLSNR